MKATKATKSTPVTTPNDKACSVCGHLQRKPKPVDPSAEIHCGICGDKYTNDTKKSHKSSSRHSKVMLLRNTLKNIDNTKIDKLLADA